MSFNITVEGGSSVRLPTAGKYCDRDIVVTATGGGGSESLDKRIDGTITEVSSAVTSVTKYAFYACAKLTSANFPNVTSIGEYAFQSCTSLTSANFPNVTKINTYVFGGCAKLTSVNFPNVTSISSNAFIGCAYLPSVNFPNVTKIESYAFRNCYRLGSADFPKATSIGANTFNGGFSLKTVILRSSTMCTLANKNAFTNCYHILGTKNATYNPTGAKDGYIYVPRDLVDSYKSASNWSNYASQFRAIEDYPEITGG